MKLCKDCKHYKTKITKAIFQSPKTEHFCMREFETIIRPSHITGEPEEFLKNPTWFGPVERDPVFERGAIPIKGDILDGVLCTPEGIFWEAKQ